MRGEASVPQLRSCPRGQPRPTPLYHSVRRHKNDIALDKVTPIGDRGAAGKVLTSRSATRWRLPYAPARWAGVHSSPIGCASSASLSRVARATSRWRAASSRRGSESSCATCILSHAPAPAAYQPGEQRRRTCSGVVSMGWDDRANFPGTRSRALGFHQAEVFRAGCPSA
jgi:hypothetical protein